MSSSGHSLASPAGGNKSPTDETHMVSTRRRVLANWISGRTLQPSTEPVVINFSVPPDFLVGSPGYIYLAKNWHIFYQGMGIGVSPCSVRVFTESCCVTHHSLVVVQLQ